MNQCVSVSSNASRKRAHTPAAGFRPWLSLLPFPTPSFAQLLPQTPLSERHQSRGKRPFTLVILGVRPPAGQICLTLLLDVAAHFLNCGHHHAHVVGARPLFCVERRARAALCPNRICQAPKNLNVFVRSCVALQLRTASCKNGGL